MSEANQEVLIEGSVVEKECGAESNCRRSSGSGDGEIDNGCCLLVTGLSKDTSANELKVFLKQFGRVGRIKIMTTMSGLKDGNNSMRFAHISMPSSDGLIKLVETVDGKELKGSTLKATKAPENGPFSRMDVISNSAKPKIGGTLEKDDKPNCHMPASSDDTHDEVIDVDQDEGLPQTQSTDCIESIINITSCSDSEPGLSSKPSQDNIIDKKDSLLDSKTDNCNGNGRRSRAIGSASRRHISRLSSFEDERRCTRDTSSSSETSHFRRRFKDTRVSRSSFYQHSRRHQNVSPYPDPHRNSRTSFNQRSRRHQNVSPYPDRHRKRPRHDSLVTKGKNENIVQIPRNQNHNRHRRMSQSNSRKEWRRSQSQSPRRGKILSFDEIKKAQHERRRKRYLEEERRNQEMERTERVRKSSKEVYMELKFLEEEKERLRFEREEIEMEKLELLRLERERLRIEREKIEREKEDVRKVKLRMKEEHQLAQCHREKNPGSGSSVVGQHQVKGQGKTMAELAIERERQLLRDSKERSEVNITSSSPSLPRRSLNATRLRNEVSEPSLSGRQYSDARPDLRMAIEEMRSYSEKRTEEKRCVERADVEKFHAVSDTPYKFSSHFHDKSSDHVAKMTDGKTNFGAILSKPSLLGRPEQWIRGGNIGTNDRGSPYSQVVSMMSQPHRAQVFAYPGYPDGMLFPRSQHVASGFGVNNYHRPL